MVSNQKTLEDLNEALHEIAEISNDNDNQQNEINNMLDNQLCPVQGMVRLLQTL
jgi:hypothetical protein